MLCQTHICYLEGQKRSDAHSTHVRRYVKHMMACGYCGDNAVFDFKKHHFDAVYDSLRRRVRTEIDMILSILPETAQEKIVKKVRKQLGDLNIEVAAGKVPRLKRKRKDKQSGKLGLSPRHVCRDWLVGECFFSI